MSDQFDIQWLDSGRTARMPSDPEYPNGIDLDLSKGKPSCSSPLTYPAPRVGRWLVECKKCKTLTVITAAGRPDDPRSFKLACKLKAQ